MTPATLNLQLSRLGRRLLAVGLAAGAGWALTAALVAAVAARPAGWSFAALAIGAAFVGLVALVAPRVALTQWLRFSDPYGDHPPYSRVIFRVEPGDTRVVYGGGLDVRVTTEGAAVDR